MRLIFCVCESHYVTACVPNTDLPCHVPLSKQQCAISFCGQSTNHCLHSHMTFLYPFSSWLTMFDCLKICSFLRESLSPFREPFELKPFGRQAEREPERISKIFPLPLRLSLSLSPSSRQWTGLRRELGCDVFHAGHI